MVAFKNVTQTESDSLFIFKNSEETNSFDTDSIVPTFMLIEALFQSAGKVAREGSGNNRGAYIVSFSKLKLKRPIFSYEKLEIHSKILSTNGSSGCFFFTVSAKVKNETVLENMSLILKQDKYIKPKFLNNCTVLDSEAPLYKLSF